MHRAPFQAGRLDMNPEQFKRLKDLFIAYQELDPEERSLYLERACRGDEELRSEAEKLLATVDDEDRFLEKPVLAQTAADQTDDFPPGTALGAFRLGRLLYSDAIHAEYEIDGEEPSRALTVKIFRPGIVSDASLRRFDRAARQLTALGHPGIAQVVGSGIYTQGARSGPSNPVAMPYLVTESVVDALPITEFARLKNMPLKNRLGLFVQAADAVYHAHGAGVLHRDLQPSTVVVDVTEKVTIVNFGVMHAVDLDIALAAAHAEVSGLFGSVQFWSPEQCRAERSAIDSRSDVYSLGLILFELLCDEPPYDVRPMPFARAARTIGTLLPTKPSELNRSAKGDLEAIVLKALEKDRARRFQSVAEFAGDIGRFLDGRSVHAMPAGWAKKKWKRFARSLSRTIARFLDRGGSKK